MVYSYENAAICLHHKSIMLMLEVILHACTQLILSWKFFLHDVYTYNSSIKWHSYSLADDITLLTFIAEILL